MRILLCIVYETMPRRKVYIQTQCIGHNSDVPNRSLWTGSSPRSPSSPATTVCSGEVIGIGTNFNEIRVWGVTTFGIASEDYGQHDQESFTFLHFRSTESWRAMLLFSVISVIDCDAMKLSSCSDADKMYQNVMKCIIYILQNNGSSISDIDLLVEKKQVGYKLQRFSFTVC